MSDVAGGPSAGELLAFLEQGIVTGEDVDEFLDLYRRTLGACAMSVGEAFGFNPWVRTLDLPARWMATHRKLQTDDPSPALLLPARRGAVYRVKGDSPEEVQRNALFKALGDFGFRDAAITTVHNPLGQPIFMALYREEGAPAFSREDAGWIELLHPHVARAFGAHQALRAIDPHGPSTLGDVLRERT